MEPKEPKWSASIEPCYCGETDEYQVELYELEVDLRLTAKFSGVTFHLTQDAAEAEARKVNGGELRANPKLRKPTPKRVQTEGDEMANAKAKRKYEGPIEAPSVQKMLARIQKRTKDSPLLDSKLDGQYLKRIARRLASYGKVASEVREGVGLVFFGKEVKA